MALPGYPTGMWCKLPQLSVLDFGALCFRKLDGYCILHFSGSGTYGHPVSASYCMAPGHGHLLVFESGLFSNGLIFDRAANYRSLQITDEMVFIQMYLEYSQHGSIFCVYLADGVHFLLVQQRYNVSESDTRNPSKCVWPIIRSKVIRVAGFSGGHTPAASDAECIEPAANEFMCYGKANCQFFALRWNPHIIRLCPQRLCIGEWRNDDSKWASSEQWQFASCLLHNRLCQHCTVRGSRCMAVQPHGYLAR